MHFMHTLLFSISENDVFITLPIGIAKYQSSYEDVSRTHRNKDLNDTDCILE